MESVLELKVCKDCHEEKPITEFYKKYGYLVVNPCKSCATIRSREWASKNRARSNTSKYSYTRRHRSRRLASASKYFKNLCEQKPWVPCYYAAYERCNNPKHKAFKYYGGKGIKLILTLDDYEYLWIRDDAKSMKRPSMDRIDSKENYTLENCHFIEQSENSKKMCRERGFNVS